MNLGRWIEKGWLKLDETEGERDEPAGEEAGAVDLHCRWQGSSPARTKTALEATIRLWNGTG